MWGFLLGAGLIMGAFLSGVAQITEAEFRRDVQYVERVEKRVKEIDRELQRKGVDSDLLGELNSYGYPINMLKEKYIDYNDKEYGELQDFYRRVTRVYNLILYVKRGVFPKILMDEVKQIESPVCGIRAEGKRREVLTIVIEDPKNERAVLDLLTRTQLQYVHLLGVETVNFEK